MTVREVLDLIHRFKISGLPVVEGSKVVGIVTNRDLRVETQLDQPVRPIMTPREKLVTVAEGAPREEALALMHKHRLEQAQTFLRETEWTVRSITELCGFASQASFNHFFSKQMGITPARYRKRSRNTAPEN